MLEGSVRKVGSRVRISAQLIDTSSGRHIWAENYDRELDDVFALQDDVARQISACLSPEIERAEWRNPAVTPPPIAAITPRATRIREFPPQLSDRRVAAVLLTHARQDISAGRLDEAQRKAMQAKELKVTYRLLDDRPERVLEEIDHLLAENPPSDPLSVPIARTSPPWSNRITERRGSRYSSRMSPVPSVEPSSTRIYSKSEKV